MQYNNDCDTCGQPHIINFDSSELTNEQIAGIEPVTNNFLCPSVTRMYRAVHYSFDFRVNLVKNDMGTATIDTINGLRKQWGDFNFEAKLDRFKRLDLAYLGIPEEYYDLLQPIVSSYYCGYYYPAMTSAGALGERILNRLLLKTRDYFKQSPHYKKIYRKDSFDQWDQPIRILKDWGVISNEVAELFTELKQFRNDAIHYNDSYDFEENSHKAVKLLVEIIDAQFNYHTRTDLFWVYNVEGEIWLRSEFIENPFVKEFILPHCVLLTPYCEPSATPPIKGKAVPVGDLSDEEFIKIRNTKNHPTAP